MRTDGSILTDQKTILKEVRDFYSKLFQNKQHIADSHLSDHYKLSKEFKKLSDEQSNSLEHEITIDELSSALKHMKNGKTPGIDGFPVDFFKVFWGKLKYFILHSALLTYSKMELCHAASATV